MRPLLFLLFFASPCLGQLGPVPQQDGFPILNPNPSNLMPFARLLVADLDGDGLQEIALYSGHDIYVYEHDGTLAPGWPVTKTQRNLLKAGDLDGDGDLELAYHANEVVFVVDHNGNLLSEVMQGTQSYLEAYTACFSDMDGDGSEELIVTARAGRQTLLFPIDSTGSILAGWPVSLDLESWDNTLANPLWFNTICAGDYNYNNRYQILIGTQRNIFNADQAPIFKFNGDGTAAIGYPRLPIGNDDASSSNLMADFRNDRECEDSGMGYAAVNLSNADGSYFFRRYLPGSQGAWTAQYPGQFDTDEDLELLFFTDSARICKPTIGAAPNWVIAERPNFSMYYPTIADVNGDGLSEIAGVLGTNPNYPFGVLDNELNFLPGWPVDLSTSNISSSYQPATCVADLDADGDLEIVVATSEAIFAFDFPAPSGKIYWSGYNGNHGNNRFVDYRNYPNEEFVRGDINNDSQVDITDFALGLKHLLSTSSNSMCMPRLDTDGNEVVNLADSITILNYLFVGTASIPEPFPACGKMPPAAYRKIYCLQSVCN